MSINEMESKVNELRELRRMADEIAAEIESIQDSIKAHMTAAGADEISGSSFKITWKNVISTRLDSKGLKAELPDIYERYTRTSSSRRFVLA